MGQRHQGYAVLPLFLLFFLIGSVPVWADDDDGDGKDKIFRSDLVRLADLGSDALGSGFGPNGNDPLRKGKVEIRGNRRVEAELRGAAPSSAYNLFFCRFGFGPSACQNLGSMTTDAEGDAEARFTFPAGLNAGAGVFVFTRDVPPATNEFVSGFQFAAAVDEGAVEVELKGRIGSINASNSSFRLSNFAADIFTGTSTRFEKLSGFGALAVGLRVEVKGFVRADGAILATKIEKEDDDEDE